MSNGGYFTLGSSEQGALPITLVSFNGKAKKKNGVQLDWTTASGENNSAIIVERSHNGFDFKRLGSVQGKGTTNSVNIYSFMDDEPLEGVNYYRLIDVDQSGKENASEIIMVQLYKVDWRIIC